MEKMTPDLIRSVDWSNLEQLVLKTAKNEAGIVKFYYNPSSFTKHTKSEIFSRAIKKIVDTLIYTDQVKKMSNNWPYITENRSPLEKYIKSKYGSKMRRIISKIVDEEEKYRNDYYYGRTTEIREQMTNDQDNKETRRKLAGEYILKNGYYSSPDLRYITRPLYGYIEHRNIRKLKDLGVKYRFVPIGEINLNGALSYYIKKNGYSNLIQGGIIKFIFNEPKSKDEIRVLTDDISELVNSFNDKLGTNYTITRVIGNMTSDSMRRSLTSKLTGEEDRFEKQYDSIGLVLERGDEEEYLAIIPMEDIDKPEMSY